MRLNRYRIKWSIFGSLTFVVIGVFTLLLHFAFDPEYNDRNPVFHWEEMLALVIIGIVGAIFGYFIGRYKEKDMNRAGWLRELGKEVLHDARSHLGIINGYATILRNYDCPIGICRKNEDLPKILEHSTRLSLLFRETLMLVKNYESSKDARSLFDIRVLLDELKKNQKKKLKV